MQRDDVTRSTFDSLIPALAEGLASPAKSTQTSAASAFVAALQCGKGEEGWTLQKVVYRGASVAEAYDRYTRLSTISYFPSWVVVEGDLAGEKLFHVLLRAPAFADGAGDVWQREKDRLAMLDHCIGYLFARKLPVKAELLLGLADTPADTWKKNVALPRNPLARRYLAVRRKPEFTGKTEMEILKELEDDDKKVEAARKALRRFENRSVCGRPSRGISNRGLHG